MLSDERQIDGGSVFKLTIRERPGRNRAAQFQGGSNGYAPVASLTWDGDGALVGTTSGGGDGTGCANNGCGVVFGLPGVLALLGANLKTEPSFPQQFGMPVVVP